MSTINRDMLIKKYINPDIEKFHNYDVKIVLENLKQNILKMPSADRPQGKWLLKDNVFHCGCCGKESHFTADDVYVYDMPLPDFCEKCGARLKGADDDY